MQDSAGVQWRILASLARLLGAQQDLASDTLGQAASPVGDETDSVSESDDSTDCSTATDAAEPK